MSPQLLKSPGLEWADLCNSRKPIWNGLNRRQVANLWCYNNVPFHSKWFGAVGTFVRWHFLPRDNFVWSWESQSLRLNLLEYEQRLFCRITHQGVSGCCVGAANSQQPTATKEQHKKIPTLLCKLVLYFVFSLVSYKQPCFLLECSRCDWCLAFRMWVNVANVLAAFRRRSISLSNSLSLTPSFSLPLSLSILTLSLYLDWMGITNVCSAWDLVLIHFEVASSRAKPPEQQQQVCLFAWFPF